MVFTVESLEGAIRKAKENIKIFDEAIEKERKSIKEFREMIDKLEEKELIRKEILKRIKVEVDNGN